jgi:hypothetical protein
MNVTGMQYNLGYWINLEFPTASGASTVLGVQLDTGSSNFAVAGTVGLTYSNGGSVPYYDCVSPQCSKTAKAAKVVYGSGAISGTLQTAEVRFSAEARPFTFLSIDAADTFFTNSQVSHRLPSHRRDCAAQLRPATATQAKQVETSRQQLSP